MARKKKHSRLKQTLNPLVTLRAQTVPNKKREASRRACRKNRTETLDK